MARRGLRLRYEIRDISEGQREVGAVRCWLSCSRFPEGPDACVAPAFVWLALLFS